jgi:PIN domain nuclease of toxin-antitoxin system
MNILENPKDKKYISSVSLWEIAIKYNLGKLDFKKTLSKFIEEVKTKVDGILQIENKYLLELSKLPNYHKDPFDRLLIATSIAENLTFITSDEKIQPYDFNCLG